jgi:hypothetical protein
MFRRLKNSFKRLDWQNGIIEIYDRQGKLVFAWSQAEDREVTEERRHRQQ